MTEAVKWYDGIEERVIEAYRRRGLKALPHEYMPVDGGCCAFGALHNDVIPNVKPLDEIAGRLNVRYDDVWDFVRGFDDGMTRDMPRDRSLAGHDCYEAGWRTAKAVIDAGL